MNQINKKEVKITDIAIKILEISEQSLSMIGEGLVEEACQIIASRDRLIKIIDSLSHGIDNASINEEGKDQLDRLFNKINAIDTEIIRELGQHKKNLNNEIANLSKKKENFKGYNLNNLK